MNDATNTEHPGKNGIRRQLADLDDLPTGELKARWLALYGKEPPRFNRQFLIKRLSYRIQELAYGGLPNELRGRMNQLLDDEGYNEIGVKTGKRKPNMDKPIPGTLLIREWDGERHEVTVREDCFEYRGMPYRSLSAVARKITGTRWNGPAFFGLRRPATNTMTEHHAST